VHKSLVAKNGPQAVGRRDEDYGGEEDKDLREEAKVGLGAFRLIARLEAEFELMRLRRPRAE